MTLVIKKSVFTRRRLRLRDRHVTSNRGIKEFIGAAVAHRSTKENKPKKPQNKPSAQCGFKGSMCPIQKDLMAKQQISDNFHADPRFLSYRSCDFRLRITKALSGATVGTVHPS